VRFVRHPLLRYRVLAVTIALFAALWLALPVLSAPATPPDTAPIPGTGTARQDPPGSCSGRPDTITFSATVQIQGGVLHITDPGGETSGTLNGDGTADLNGQSESYHLLSSQGTTLNLRELNGGCNFLTTIVLQQPLPPLVGGAVASHPTQLSGTTSQPTVSATPGGVIVPETSGGRSWAWYWGAGIVVGIVLVGGGWWYYYYYYEPGRGGAPSQPEGFDPVPPTAPPSEGGSEEGDDRQEIG
jgi:hypothetical protein